MRRRARHAGFGLIELLVVIAISGVLLSIGVPMGLSYHRSARNTAAAQQIRTLLNLARQIAIDERAFVCVHVPAPTQLCFFVNSTCTGAPWRGSITDADGNIPLPTGLEISASASPVFDYLGRALPAATFTVTNAAAATTVTVSVATSGRITIP